MIRLFEKTPSLLLPGHVVKFETKEPGGEFSPLIRGGEYFVVERTAQVPFKTGITLNGQDGTQVDMSDQSQTSANLYPTSPNTLYEILIGFKGNKDFIVYPVIPAGHYPLRLEEATMYPDPNDPTRMWLGAYTPADSPADEPKLRIHTVKDLEPLYLQIVNAGSDYEKLIIYMLINKCEIKKLSESEAKKVETYRVIQHYGMLEW